MRVRITVLLIVAALAACGRTPIVQPLAADALLVRPLDVKQSPSPLVEVRVGGVRAVFPKTWEARMLPSTAFAQHGFEASPRLEDWEHGANGVPGIEAFWIDIDRVGIPSDYYYLAARSTSFGRLDDKLCSRPRAEVIANHPPDFTGARFSESDFVASARGSCVGHDGTPSRWAFVVAAPGFGPTREVGIPTSGLYVVMAEVSGPHAEVLLKEMLARATFGKTTVPQLVQAAGREQPH